MSTHSFSRARLRANGQITIPVEVREQLNLKEGDDLAFYVDEQGKVVLTRLQTIPPDQAWFWTEHWQRMERAAQADSDAGRVHTFDDVEDMISWLDEETDHAQD